MHCLQDTWGARFHPDLQVPDQASIVTKGVRFDKDQNSVFEETGLARRLELDGVSRLLVAGLALDVCVKASVLDGLKEGLRITVLLDGCRAVSQDSGRRAIEEMERAGATCISGGEA